MRRTVGLRPPPASRTRHAPAARKVNATCGFIAETPGATPLSGRRSRIHPHSTTAANPATTQPAAREKRARGPRRRGRRLWWEAALAVMGADETGLPPIGPAVTP